LRATAYQRASPADLNDKLLTHGSAEILITAGRQDEGTSATHLVVSIPRFKVVAPARVGEHWWRVRGRRVLDDGKAVDYGAIRHELIAHHVSCLLAIAIVHTSPETSITTFGGLIGDSRG
jgi:hypothetical protein